MWRHWVFAVVLTAALAAPVRADHEARYRGLFSLPEEITNQIAGLEHKYGEMKARVLGTSLDKALLAFYIPGEPVPVQGQALQEVSEEGARGKILRLQLYEIQDGEYKLILDYESPESA